MKTVMKRLKDAVMKNKIKKLGKANSLYQHKNRLLIKAFKTLKSHAKTQKRRLTLLMKGKVMRNKR